MLGQGLPCPVAAQPQPDKRDEGQVNRVRSVPKTINQVEAVEVQHNRELEVPNRIQVKVGEVPRKNSAVALTNKSKKVRRRYSEALLL